MKIKYYVCDECGSEDLSWDAYACWDVENQCMELENTFDECVCQKCAEVSERSSCSPVEKEKESDE